MVAQPVTLREIRSPQSSELGELSALALLWGIARAITQTPPNALDFFMDELTADELPAGKDYVK